MHNPVKTPQAAAASSTKRRNTTGFPISWPFVSMTGSPEKVIVTDFFLL
jgi:hypothetical protein